MLVVDAMDTVLVSYDMVVGRQSSDLSSKSVHYDSKTVAPK